MNIPIDIKEILIFIGLLFNVIGGIILGFAIIKTFKDVYFESFRTMHTSLFKNSDQFKSIKEKMVSYLKKNPKSFKYYRDISNTEPSEKAFREDEFYLNIFQYVSLRKSRIKGIWGISFLIIGFVIQIISIFLI